MEAKLFVSTGKKNEFKGITLPDVIASALFDATIPASKVSDDKRMQAASVLASVWDKVVAKYASGKNENIDRVEIDGYTVTRNVDGNPVSFPASATIANLNMVAMLAGIATRAEAKKKFEAETESLKALVKQSVSEEVHGYNAGKRGRKSSNQTTASLEGALLDALK